jgi:hypothetical protein
MLSLQGAVQIPNGKFMSLSMPFNGFVLEMASVTRFLLIKSLILVSSHTLLNKAHVGIILLRCLILQDRILIPVLTEPGRAIHIAVPSGVGCTTTVLASLSRNKHLGKLRGALAVRSNAGHLMLEVSLNFESIFFEKIDTSMGL